MTPVSKLERRRMNFGKRNTVRSTTERKYHGGTEHAPSRSDMNDNGTPWIGFSKRSKRKPWPVEKSWRDWLRESGLKAWRDGL